MEWGGVGLLSFLPCKDTGVRALKATFVTRGFPIHHLRAGSDAVLFMSRT